MSRAFNEELQDRFHLVISKQMLPKMVLPARDRYIKACMKIYAELYPNYKEERKKANIYDALDQFIYALRVYGVSFCARAFRKSWLKNWEFLSDFFVIPKDFDKTKTKP